MFLVFAVIDGGLVMGRYGSVNHAAAEGARVGAVQTGAAGDVATLILGRVNAQAAGGDYTEVSCGKPFKDATTDVVCITWQSAYNAAGDSVGVGDAGSSLVVMVKYHYKLLTPLVSQIGTWDIIACATEPQERAITVPSGSRYDGLGTTCGDEGQAQATATTQANATATAHADATATSIASTATAQANATATSVAQTATAQANQTATSVAKTATATSWTATPTPSPTPCPFGGSGNNCRATQTAVAKTATASAPTNTPTPTSTPTPTNPQKTATAQANRTATAQANQTATSVAATATAQAPCPWWNPNCHN